MVISPFPILPAFIFLLGPICIDLCAETQIQSSESTLVELAKEKRFDQAMRQIESGSDVNAKNSLGMTPLHWALQHREDRLVEALLAAGADPNATNRYLVPALWIPCRAGDSANAIRLLEAGGDANSSLQGGETVLMTAARTGSVEIIRYLAEHGAELNAAEQSGQTALMWACAEGQTEAVETLLKLGADPLINLPSGFNAFFFAAREGKTKTVFKLIDSGFDVNQQMRPKRRASKGPSSGMTALMLAIENGHFELAKELVLKGADPNVLATGYAPLHAITWIRKPIRGDGDPPPTGSGKLSSLEFVRFLIANGADVNIRHKKHSTRRSGLNRTDATPILLAAETGDLPLIQLLVQKGGDPDLKNHDHVTPLLAACGIGVLSDGDESAGSEEDAINTSRYLLDQGADINAVDDQGKSVMHGAAFKSWPNLIQKLDQWGADIAVWNQKNEDGWTPLTIAKGQRPGNFRPSEPTVKALQEILNRQSQ